MLAKHAVPDDGLSIHLQVEEDQSRETNLCGFRQKLLSFGFGFVGTMLLGVLVCQVLPQNRDVQSFSTASSHHDTPDAWIPSLPAFMKRSDPAGPQGLVMLKDRPPSPSEPSGRPSLPGKATSSARRDFLIASAVAQIYGADAAQAAGKGYQKAGDYFEQETRKRLDQKAHSLFETLNLRAGQIAVFSELLEAEDFKGLADLSIAWEQGIRKETLEPANGFLEGDAKKQGSALNKKIEADLKKLFKVGKSRAMKKQGAAAKKDGAEELPEVIAALQQSMDEFVALEPERLVKKFGKVRAAATGAASGEVPDL